jgi:hypothetical protein
MGRADGSRECAPDDKVRDTHHVLDDSDGFREALNPSYDLLPDGRFNLPDGQITDSAVICLSSLVCKNILIFRRPKSLLYFPPSRSPEGRFAIVTKRGAGCGGRWRRQRRGRLLADGEVVWS